MSHKNSLFEVGLMIEDYEEQMQKRMEECMYGYLDTDDLRQSL